MKRSKRKLRISKFAVAFSALCVFVLFAEVAHGQIVLNEVLARNGGSSIDDEGDTEDWVELLNTSGGTASTAGLYLTDDASIPLKWALPDLSIAPGGRVLVWLSGKDRYTPSAEALSRSEAFEPRFIKRGDIWRYRLGGQGEGPPPGWHTTAFDDSDWAEGPSGFGYGDNDDATLVPAGTNAVFLRRVFSIADPASLPNLVLQIDYDDGFVAYLNGVRIASANFSGDPDYSSWSQGGHEAGDPVRYPIEDFQSLLQPGENVLAVVGLNVGSGSSDMTVIPELGVVPPALHANFRLDADGDYLGLYNSQGVLIDEIILPPQTEDHSYGRNPEGGGPWRYLLTPTPGEPNLGPSFEQPIPSTVVCEPPPGRYEQPVSVRMTFQFPGAYDIRYTTDGREPTASSSRYSGPIEVSRNSVFRIAAFIQGRRATKVFSKSYFIGGDWHLPLISISMDPDDFAEVHLTRNGRGRAWERPGFIEFFDRDGRLLAGVGMGLRLHGGAGRSGDMNTKKAYRVYFRGVYGAKKLRAPVIPETPVQVFDKLVLRSNFNDCFRTNGRAAYIRDQLIRELHAQMGQLASHGAWYNLFVNMRYRGIYNVVERMDYEFLSSYLPDKEWDVIKTGNDVLDGTIDEWRKLHDFVTQNDMSYDGNYYQALKMLDIENFTSYMILNIWAQNHDWPHNNWYAARPRRPDGKWIFLSWDAEFGIGLIPQGYTADTFSFVFTRNGYLRDTLQALLANAHYREYFIHQADYYVRTVLDPYNVTVRINLLAEEIAPDIPKEVTVSGGNGSYEKWLQNVDAMRNFARNRNTYFMQDLTGSTLFSFPEITTPWISSVRPSTVILTPETTVEFTGIRFDPLTIFTFGTVDSPVEEFYSSSRVVVKVPFRPECLGTPILFCRDAETGYGSRAGRLLRIKAPVPQISYVWPARGSSAGGETISIAGRYFFDGVEVYFGTKKALEVRRPTGEDTLLEVVTPPGAGKVKIRVVNVQPARIEASGNWYFTYVGRNFIRGDANGNGEVDLADATSILSYLFAGSRFECLDALDTNDSGSVDMADAIYLLAYLFAGGAEPPPPFPQKGPDVTSDPLPCD